MRPRPFAAIVAFSLGVLPVAGCKESAAPVVPSAITVTDGAGQQSVVGAPLSGLISVLVTGSNGRPFQGAVVAFSASGGGGANPPTVTTDVAGMATTTWTLGPNPGTQTLTASIPGVTPATADATALDPCDVATAYTFGSTVGGALASIDCNVGGAFIDFFSFTMPLGASGRFTQTSSSFDTFLALNTAAGDVVAVNDDEPGNAGSTNSSFRVLAASGAYEVWASSYLTGVVGSYLLSSFGTPVAAIGCEEVWVTKAILTSQVITSNDCLSGGYYSDQFLLVLGPGRSATITLRSSSFDAFLIVVDLATSATFTDDDSGGGTDSQVFVSTSSLTLFLIDAGTFLSGATGAFTLQIQ